jgi:hypothetical protein
MLCMFLLSYATRNPEPETRFSNSALRPQHSSLKGCYPNPPLHIKKRIPPEKISLDWISRAARI